MYLIFFQCPQTPDEWREIAAGFWKHWQFPNCIGALDGKHVAIRKPPHSGSEYFNYKGFCSIILMALVDANYCFIWVDIGSNGRCADGGVFADTELRKAIEEKDLGIPPSEPLPNDDVPLLYAIVADDAFPLKDWLLKPYPIRNMTHDQRIFNYRLCRSRRIVENAFGVLGNRWRVLTRKIEVSTERAQLIVLAACSLHNLIRKRYPNVTSNLFDREDPVTHNVNMGEWRDGPVMEQLEALKGNNATKAGKAYREYLTKYFMSPAGSVSWQEKQARITY